MIRSVIIGVATVIVAANGPALVVYVLATLSAVVGTAFRPAQAALLPVLAHDPSELTAANVASSTIEMSASSPARHWRRCFWQWPNTPTVFALNAASFLWSATFVIGLSADTRPPADEEKKSGFVAEALKGFGTIVAPARPAPVGGAVFRPDRHRWGQPCVHRHDRVAPFCTWDAPGLASSRP